MRFHCSPRAKDKIGPSLIKEPRWKPLEVIILDLLLFPRGSDSGYYS